jgi:hypothetical protein
MMLHPADETLALYAGNDLRAWTRFRAACHLRRCERCSRHVEEFRELREFLDAERDELPQGLEWSGLAAEMKANIRLGVSAGQCVAQSGREEVRMRWRTPAVALPVLLLVILGWILQTVPPPATLAPASAGALGARAVVLNGGPAGIGVEQDGRGLSIPTPRDARDVTFSVGGDSVRARYVDADTGQVKIYHVYAE